MINKEKFEALLHFQDEYCLSIYIPTYKTGNNQEDQLRFKNVLKEATEKLEMAGLESKDANRFLVKAYNLLNDDDFWLKLSEGLAVFISREKFEYYILPVDVNPFVSLDKTFYLRPMLPVLNGKQRFFLLALSQNEVRFFEGNKYSITPVVIEDLVPKDMEEALNLDVSVTDLQSHSGNPSSGSVIYHGNNLGSDHKIKQLRQYFRIIDNGLMKMLHDESSPLILAGVDYLMPIYREVSNYNNIINTHISGNPEHHDPILLHEKAWRIMESFNEEKLSVLRETYSRFLSHRRASSELSSILRAANSGKVDTLFLNKDKKIWGEYDPRSQEVNIGSKDKRNNQDLLEKLAKMAMDKGGTVYNLPQEELPETDQWVSAIYRY